MSLRNMFQGSIVKPGFNPLAAPTPSYLYNLFSWGRNNYGQLGLNNATNYSSPKQVGSGTEYWTAVANGNFHSLAIKNDGTLWAWGRNNFGQLGINSAVYYKSSPTQIGALTTWASIAANNLYSFAIKTDGTLWAWGRNAFGNLGLGNTTYYSSPKQVGALTNWANVGAGTNAFAFAVKTDGTLWTWGQNGNGQLGLGNTTNYSSPKQVGSLTNWAKVSAHGGAGFMLAIKTDGTLWAWGRNQYGSLGLGNTTDYSSPKQVGALTNWLSVSASSYSNSISVKTNGTLWTWGRNNVGQLGLGNITNYSSPKQVGSLTNWLKIAASGYGEYFCAATNSSGALYAWGQNTYGQLGDNTTTGRSSPVLVPGSQLWLDVACGSYHMTGLG